MGKLLLRCIAAFVALLFVVTWRTATQTQSENRVAQIPGVPSDRCHPGAGDRPWTDKNQTPECRALEVVAQMTYEEKLHFTGYSGGAVPRLGITSRPGSDGPNGIAGGGIFPGMLPPRSQHVTAFPNVVTLAATWDRDLAKRYGEAIGEEFAAKGMGSVLGPTINLLRTWHWGRAAETFGEDPYLMGEMVVPEIQGIQSRGVIAVVKHFAGNDQEYGRTGVSPDFAGIDERITEKAMHEIYLPHFKAAVERGHNGGIMCAYNQINGVFSCNSPWLLGNLREWGFDGYIVPDAAFAQRSLLAAAQAGVDALSPTRELDDLLKAGTLPQDTLDRIVFHTLTPNFRLGLYDSELTGKADAVVSTPGHVALSKEVASAGAVLLKNAKNVLPLGPSVKSIAIIGDDAGPNAQVMETGSAEVHVTTLSVPLDAIKARAGSAVHVTYAPGTLGIGPLPAIPGDVLAPPEGHEGHGLLATYYKTADWSGDPVGTRVDPTIDFSGAPLPEFGGRLPGENGGGNGGAGNGGGFARPVWSARWVGTLTPAVTGKYRFSITCGGTAELYVDNKPAATVMRADFPMTGHGMVHLIAGKTVPFQLKYSSASNLLGLGLKVGWQPPDEEMIAKAVDAAKQSDVAVIFAGEKTGEGHDKIFLNLPGDQDELIEAVARANPRTIIVLHTSGPVSMPWIDRVAAVVEAWYPGQEAGNSIAAVLFGDVNPSGKLPVTFPVNMSQGPATNFLEYPGDGHTANFDEGVFVGYRWYDEKKQEPLFPFGFGLSYTTFQYGPVEVSGNGVNQTVSVKITNAGSRAGAEVAQLYLEFPKEANEPPRQLKGFDKVTLAPGESKTAKFTLNKDSFSAWDETSHQWRVLGGAYTVDVGSSSRDIRSKSTISIPKS